MKIALTITCLCFTSVECGRSQVIRPPPVVAPPKLPSNTTASVTAATTTRTTVVTTTPLSTTRTDVVTTKRDAMVEYLEKHHQFPYNPRFLSDCLNSTLVGYMDIRRYDTTGT